MPRLGLSPYIGQQLGGGALMAHRRQQLLAATGPLGGNQLAAHIVAQVDHRYREPALCGGAGVDHAAQPDVGGLGIGRVAAQEGRCQRLGDMPLDAGQLLGRPSHVDGVVPDQIVLWQLYPVQVGDSVDHAATSCAPAHISGRLARTRAAASGGHTALPQRATCAVLVNFLPVASWSIT
ncbi:hypothetical protein D3C80_978830 [compost metagenome]